MKTASKHSKKQKTYVMRESDIRKLENDIKNEVSETAICMVLAWLKDANYIENDSDVLVAEYRRFESWLKAIDDHLISINDIREIIRRDTGMEVRIRKGDTNE